MIIDDDDENAFVHQQTNSLIHLELCAGARVPSEHISGDPGQVPGEPEEVDVGLLQVPGEREQHNVHKDFFAHRFARIAKPASLVSVGLILGIVARTLAKGRIRGPEPPEASYVVYDRYDDEVQQKREQFKALMEGTIELFEPSVLVPLPGESFGVVPPSGWCGKARCTPGDRCCSFPKGDICGARDSVCCSGPAGTIVCRDQDTCCLNSHGDAYCCSIGYICQGDVCVDPALCFPGSATVRVESLGSTPLASLRVGDRVLVRGEMEAFEYEPVLGFLHAVQTDKAVTFLVITHIHGEFRASPNHVVFLADGSDKLAADLKVGDQLVIAPAHTAQNATASKVLAIRSSSGHTGMYAPLTASGTLVVDDVVASAYASHSSTMPLSHSMLHAVFFPLRLYHRLNLGGIFAPLWAKVCGEEAAMAFGPLCHGSGLFAGQHKTEDMHPFVSFVQHHFTELARLLNAETGM